MECAPAGAELLRGDEDFFAQVPDRVVGAALRDGFAGGGEQAPGQDDEGEDADEGEDIAQGAPAFDHR